ncbi:hypothetical protein [Streptomyces sp. NPDC002851]
MAPTHWHAYSYTGRSYTDAQIRRGETPDNYPPIEIKDWLVRPRGQIAGTFGEVDGAVTWLADELKANPPADDAAFPIAERAEHARRTLAQEAGCDVVLGYYSVGLQYVSRALIACPRPDRTCPQKASR